QPVHDRFIVLPEMGAEKERVDCPLAIEFAARGIASTAFTSHGVCYCNGRDQAANMNLRHVGNGHGPSAKPATLWIAECSFHRTVVQRRWPPCHCRPAIWRRRVDAGGAGYYGPHSESGDMAGERPIGGAGTGIRKAVCCPRAWSSAPAH